MNKKIKKIIAFTLAGITAGFGQATINNKLFITPAYASNDDADELDDITVTDDDGDDIDLYTDSSCDDEYDEPDVGDTYYGESDTDSITIDIDGADEDNVRIFCDNDDYEVGDDIDLDDGVNKIYIRVYEDEYDDDEDYSSSDYNQYTLKIEYDNDDDDDNDELTEINIEDNNGNDIVLYTDEDYNDELDDDPEEDEAYYAKSSTKKISIDTDVDDDYVRIIYDGDEYENGDDISLSTGSNLLKIRVYDDEYDDDEDYDDSDYDQYKVYVNYNSVTDTNLASLNIGSVAVALDSSTTTYNNAVSNPTSSLSIKAVPKDTGSTVTINGTEVTSANSYTQTVNLNVGNNPITIKVSNGGSNEKTYTLNISRSAASSTATPATSTTVTGTGWKQVNGVWYYYNNDGSKATGWKYINGQWYYMDTTGKMKTGWVLSGGKWYYLQASGAMAKNTSISGYRIGSDGAWIQ